ncbi:hypothetical protein BDP27DRAFT_1336384 [Rhodocollybia butyracea]|uniref:Uncharacterized protein n=1 Tax=Rhodocollybia butyracea TaxID=206335 RepID=A0A9P5U1P0_9AGAR|nr:hypothetical protein BDP27DRAFT_1336384 [Rhodocollybia butyracea]
MSARAQQLMSASAMPLLYFPQSPTSGSQAHAQAFPVIAAAHGQFTSYPPPYNKGADEELLYTYASFLEEPVAALSVNRLRDDTWAICIPVPIPNINRPTLLALSYMIKYATACDSGNSTIQTDTILTSKKLPGGVVTEDADLGIYHQDGTIAKNDSETGFAPLMIDHKQALCLSTTLAMKSSGSTGQWSHYLDNQHITPNVRVTSKESHLYVVFHVNEYPTALTVRSLSVKVSATWQKEEVELKAIAEAERKAREEAARLAKLDQERRAREAEEKQARVEEKQARAEEKQARADELEARREEKKAREDEKRWRDEEREARKQEVQARAEEKQARAEERQEREEAKNRITMANAPHIADQKLQTVIKDKLAKLGDKCTAGWRGSHSFTYEELGIRR